MALYTLCLGVDGNMLRCYQRFLALLGEDYRHTDVFTLQMTRQAAASQWSASMAMFAGRPSLPSSQKK